MLEQDLRQWPNNQPALDQCTYVVRGRIQGGGGWNPPRNLFSCYLRI